MESNSMIKKKKKKSNWKLLTRVTLIKTRSNLNQTHLCYDYCYWGFTIVRNLPSMVAMGEIFKNYNDECRSKGSGCHT